MERKEAIEIVRKLYNESLFMKKDKEAMVTLIPELRESEDERIRQLLIRFVAYDMSDNYSDDFTPADCVAWLEKQGKNNMGISEATKKKLEDNLNKALEKETPESFNEFLDEQNTAWSEEDEYCLDGAIETEMYMLDVVNGIKKFDVGNESIKEECTKELNWLKSLKDRVLPQPRQEWSEEDEQLYNDLSDTYFYNDEDYPEETYKLMLKRVLDWMTKRAKSLRPNYWKPSEEQMDILCKVSTYGVLSSSVRDVLQSLYNDLKKL